MRDLTKLKVRTGSGYESFCPYPIGGIYISYLNTSPASIWGGSWTQLGNALVAFAGVSDGQSGYASPQTIDGSLYISVDQMPTHAHSLTETVLGYDSGKRNFASGSTYTYGSRFNVATSGVGGGGAIHPTPPVFLCLETHCVNSCEVINNVSPQI